MIRIASAIVVLALIVFTAPTSAQDESISQVSITASVRTYVLAAPLANAELVQIYEANAEETAYGRDEDAHWLRILDGWVLGEVFNTEGEVGALPDATHSFDSSVTRAATLYAGPSTRWFEAVGEIDSGDRLLVIGRSEDGSWLNTPVGWLDTAKVGKAGDVSLLPITPSGVIITAKLRTFILSEPDISAEFVDVFEAGEEALAIGHAGDWLQIARGWVSAGAVEIIGELASLPYSGESIEIEYSRNYTVYVRNRPRLVGVKFMRKIEKGAVETASGRTEDGKFLFLGDGWVLSSSVDAADDIMDLPIMNESGSTNLSEASSNHAAPVPSPETKLDASEIRTLVSRHADDIRILDIEISNSSTTIDYDLKPWPFIPNEQIANEVAFKIICAIRVGQDIPNTLKLIGLSHFTSDIGRKFTAPSVSMDISASNANRIVCRGNDASDINWRRIASRYKSHPIPSGASIDYD